MPEFRVDAKAAGDRLDRYLAAQAPHLSRSRLQALIKTGHVTLDGKPATPDRKVRAGALVSVTEPPPEASKLEPEAIPLEVLFEDADLLVINKPPGLVVHPAAGHARHTLVHALLAHCSSLSGIGGERRPGIVHRLDKDTSGCLVVAKNDAAHAGLSRQFAARTVTKIYLALVRGSFAAARSGVVENRIGRHPVDRKKMAVLERGGREARTAWRVVQELPGAGSLVECTLHTGRTHQIRVHMKHLGHPLLGDALYAPRTPPGGARWPRQMLHAWKLGFAHPRTGKPLLFCSPLPGDFILAGARPSEER
jgi:23S rRNA pseudouridine1911/1915/1917 synthase